MGEPAQPPPSNPALRGRYLLSPNVVLMPLDDGTAQLVDLDGAFFGLSETATQMLRGVLDLDEQDAVQRIAAEYNADHNRIYTDLTALLGTLRAKGLIRRCNDHLPAIRLRTAIALAISYPILRIVAPIRNQRLKALVLLATARLCFALAGWARTIEAWRKCLIQPHAPAANSERERLIGTIDSATSRSASELPSIACKERALCCWFMLHSAGVRARLVMGVRFPPLSGHCWCEVDERILTDSPEHCKAYAPVICYDG